MLRMLDPKWNINVEQMFDIFAKLPTKIYIAGRTVNGIYTTRDDIEILTKSIPFKYLTHTLNVKVQSLSTELRCIK